MRKPFQTAHEVPTMVILDLDDYNRALGRIRELLAGPGTNPADLELAALSEAIRGYQRLHHTPR